MSRIRSAGARLLRQVAGPWARRRPSAAEPRIAILIPLFDTEASVERCLRSAMGQTLAAIEILCIDDASPDHSAAIVQRLAREDGRIRLIRHPRNLGLGGARNSGIAAARAPYVIGLDSDDILQPEMMERLWQASDGGQADVVACGFLRVRPDGSPLAAGHHPPPGRYSNAAGELNIFEFFTPSFTTKIWRRSLFLDHGIRFPEHTYFEDLAVTPQLLHVARDVRVIEGAYYHYVVRPGSITRSFSPRHLLDHLQIFDILDRFLEREGLRERHGQAWLERIDRSLAFHASEVIASGRDRREQEAYLRWCLIMKIAYLESRHRLSDSTAPALQTLLASSRSLADLPPPPAPTP